MKRTIVFVAVLSWAGIASAGLQFEVAGGKAMVTGKLDTDMFLVLTAGDGASLSNFVLGAAAPAASYFAASAADFAGVGVPVPAGYEGEGWFLGSFPGEAYKQGVQLVADLAVTTSQETRTWEEIVTGECIPGIWKIRYFTEITHWVKGSLSLTYLSADYSQGGTIQALSLDSQTVTTTFEDGPCPEPTTLSLLGLGMILIRRRRLIV